jgi:hypothetical protein
MRRFRWSITADGVSRPQGTWYATSYGGSYPAGTNYSIVTVTCVDGFGALGLATLPTLDPPSGETINDVILADQPFAYYPLDEKTGKTVHPAVRRRAARRRVRFAVRELRRLGQHLLPMGYWRTCGDIAGSLDRDSLGHEACTAVTHEQ